jgi:hypothetical protein
MRQLMQRRRRVKRQVVLKVSYLLPWFFIMPAIILAILGVVICAVDLASSMWPADKWWATTILPKDQWSGGQKFYFHKILGMIRNYLSTELLFFFNKVKI